MKLSQIRNLSWAAALVAIAFAGYFVQTVLHKSKGLETPSVAEWMKPKVDYSEYEEAERMSENNLRNAISFITKRAPPKIVKPVTSKAPVTATVTKPVTPVIQKPKMKLVLISYDEKPGGRHAAFIISKRYAHPYFEGDLIEGSSYRVKTIHRDRVIVVSPQGKTSELTIEFKTIAAKSSTKGIFANVIPASRKPVIKRAPPPKPKPVAVTQQNPKQPQHRTVPKWRDSKFDNDYGINVIEYNPDPDGSRRFAISDKDLKKLEGNMIRLMTEAGSEVAYDSAGVPIGVKVVYRTDKTLLQRYGIQNGDILTHVDGSQVRSHEEGMKIYKTLSPNTRRVKIQMKRNNRPISMYLEMDDFPNAPGKER